MAEMSRRVKGGAFLSHLGELTAQAVQLVTVSEILTEPDRWLPVWGPSAGDGGGYARLGWSDFDQFTEDQGAYSAHLRNTPSGLLVAVVEIPQGEHDSSQVDGGGWGRDTPSHDCASE